MPGAGAGDNAAIRLVVVAPLRFPVALPLHGGAELDGRLKGFD